MQLRKGFISLGVKGGGVRVVAEGEGVEGRQKEIVRDYADYF